MEELREDWTQYVTNDDEDGEKFWELRDSFPSGFDAALYSTAVIIEWHYGDAGLPGKATLLALHELEEHLSPLNDPGGNSILIHIIRGGGTSELAYYVRDYQQFIYALNQALAGKPRYPIQIEYFPDPAWEYRRSIVDNFSQ